MRILVVEEQRALANAIAEGLRRQAMAVDVAYDGRAASEHLMNNAYDVVVLDRGLSMPPNAPISRTVASSANPVKVLMLTSAGVSRHANGQAVPAHDYLTKPFVFGELVAKIRALGRRNNPPRPRVLTRAGIQMDLVKRELTRHGRQVRLSRKEFAVLELLLAAGGAPLPADLILKKVWGASVDPFSNVLRVTIMMLRRKLGEPPVVETISGVGYRIR